MWGSGASRGPGHPDDGQHHHTDSATAAGRDQSATLEGQTVSAATIAAGSGGRPTIVSFRATWCKPCIAELTNITEEYTNWQKETGGWLVAISIDDTRNAAKVAPLVRDKGGGYAAISIRIKT